MKSQPIALVARTQDNVSLALDYCSPAIGKTLPPIIMVHGYAQNRLTWHHDLQSLPRRLAQLGHPSYFMDLRGHGRSRTLSNVSARGYGDFIDQDLPAAVNFVRQHSGQDQVILLGHSMGGLISLLYAAKYPWYVQGVATMASPCRSFGLSPSFRLRSHWLYGALAAYVRTAAHGKTLAPLLPGIRLDVLGRIEYPIDKLLIPLLPGLLKRAAERVFFPVRPWLKDSLPVGVEKDRMTKAFDRASGGVTAETLTLAYRGYLPGEHNQDLLECLENLRKPVLLISSPDDQMLPSLAAFTAADLPGCQVSEHQIPGFGHGDIVLGKTAPTEIWPILETWLAKN
jgi:poly[(R)-3-hydroxyalkanoate] polymerase subunit PhaC